jgi:hypothetical protein
MNLQNVQYMDMDMQHGHESVARTRTCRMDPDMQQGFGHTPWTWKSIMNIDMGM